MLVYKRPTESRLEAAGSRLRLISRETSPAEGLVNARRSTTGLQVHALLRRQIVEGKLVPRQRLSENELSTQLGISRTPVREAFGKLEEEGLVEIVPQYGTFVAPIRIDDVYDNQFVRETMECGALAKAVARVTPEDARALSAILDQQSRHRTGDGVPFFLADEAMHAKLMEIAGHQRAWRVVEQAKVQLDRVRRLAVHSTAKRASILEEHRAIIDRVVHRDEAGAVAAMTSHLRRVFQSVEPVMQKHPEFFTDVPPSARPARQRA
jgi:GntR family transcriptional regulator, rspAB operon transcriptional repressor